MTNAGFKMPKEFKRILLTVKKEQKPTWKKMFIEATEAETRAKHQKVTFGKSEGE